MQELTTLWNAVLEQLRRTYKTDVIDLWFGDAKLIVFDDNQTVIALKNDFKKNIVQKRYNDVLKKSIIDF